MKEQDQNGNKLQAREVQEKKAGRLWAPEPGPETNTCHHIPG